MKDKTFRRIEAILYNYPLMKLNLEKLQPSFGTSVIVVGAPAPEGYKESEVERVGIYRADYSRKIEFIEKVLNVLTPEEKKFVELRYFQKLPFKSIEREMHLSESTLFRIRQRIIRSFAVAFGWE